VDVDVRHDEKDNDEERKNHMSERDAYVKKLKAQLDEWNADTDRLEARARKAGAEASLAYERQAKTLRRQRDDAKARLAEVQNAGKTPGSTSRRERTRRGRTSRAAWRRRRPRSSRRAALVPGAAGGSPGLPVSRVSRRDPALGPEE